MWSTDDTIAAIASAKDVGLRAIVRVSGPETVDVIKHVFSCEHDWPTCQRARHWQGVVDLQAPLGKVPCQLMLWPGARSYTRQPSAELHLPGATPLAEQCVRLLCEHGARLAKPGEFTLRAFLAGRIDLTQAEAVLGVIDAQSSDELATALRQLSGNLAGPLADARAQLLSALSHLEAGLDFADEDIEFISQDELRDSLAAALQSVEATLIQIEGRGQSDGLPRVAIYGRPNSGKSSLFNRLCGARAIVSSLAGTTRDYLIAETAIGGAQCELIDTAGLDPELSDDVDLQSQTLGQQQINEAALRVLCIDLSAIPSAWENEQLATKDPQRMVVGTKSDVANAMTKQGMFACSSVTGEGLEQVQSEIAARLAISKHGDVVQCTAVRSRESLRRTKEALLQAIDLVDAGGGEELVSLELRTALDGLGDVAGRLDYEEVLDQVFRQFCIGK